MCDYLQPHEVQHGRLPCTSPSPRVYSNSCPLSWWCYPNTSSLVVPFSSCLQSFLATGSFPMSKLFASGSWKISISPSNEYPGLIFFRIYWFDLLVDQGTLKSLIQHQNLKASILWRAACLWSTSHIHTWLLKKTIALTRWTFVSKVMSLLLNMLSRFFIALLPSKHLWISWL